MALLVEDSVGTLALVRWHSAEDEDELIDFALRRVNVKESEPDLLFDNEFPKWVMFDSASDPSVRLPAIRDFRLPLGQIRAATVFVQSDRNSAIVHTFRHAN